jgi:hypothetical protein
MPKIERALGDAIAAAASLVVIDFSERIEERSRGLRFA